MKKGIVKSVSKSAEHSFSKINCDKINLIKGIGVEGDAHAGRTVKHRSRVAKDPSQVNLRQVHLIHSELFDELEGKGFTIGEGEIGENITTLGIDVLALPKGTVLKIGNTAAVEVTGLRNPCSQLDTLQKGLMKAVLDKDNEGNLVRKAGIMGIVQESGEVRVGDEIEIVLPAKPYVKLERV